MITAPFTKSYDHRTVLNMPSVELEDGKITAVIGANGSGKSTLARVLAGIEQADGEKTARVCPSVGYMPQKSYAFRMSTEKNILLNGQDRQRAAALMDALHIKELGKQRAKKLSGGETAKMALARLLMRPYSLVILDEATAAMDMESTLAAEALLRQYCRETGCALLLITHSISQARRIADNILFLHQGELVEQGAADKLLSSPADPRTRRFLDFYGV